MGLIIGAAAIVVGGGWVGLPHSEYVGTAVMLLGFGLWATGTGVGRWSP